MTLTHFETVFGPNRYSFNNLTISDKLKHQKVLWNY
jgi:hypothetical protein